MTHTQKLHRAIYGVEWVPWLISVAGVALMILALHMEGRIWWCKYNDLAIYINDAWDNPHTSQHVFDPYTFTHLLHGLLFFWLTSWLFRKCTNTWKFTLSTLIEAAWEVLENSSIIIEKYRANTASVDYFGDTIANSLGDLIACALGFWIAHKIKWQHSVSLFVLVELVLILWIRDSLLLNIIMLLTPLEALKSWQLGS